MSARFLIGVGALVSSAPAWAQDAAPVPEGSQLTLFVLGLLGVIVGRRASIAAQRRRRDRD